MTDHLRDATKKVAEPVAWQWLNTANFRKKLPADAIKSEWNPLYAAPQPRKRLTREQAMRIVEQNPDTMMAIRMTEAAHGIEAAVWGDGK
jgi:hypothetical protein